MSEAPFKVTIPDEKIALLKAKLELATFPDELEDSGWDYGVPLADLRRLVARWKDGYDWKAHEAEINKLPQFTRDIEVEGYGSTLNIHYVHQKSEVANAIPLLFVHGWPGSFLEVRKVLPLLTAVSPDHPSFHVVAFSLPGFGFSEAPKKKAFLPSHYAEVGNKLMLALGYNEYVTQGGDWGWMVTRHIAIIYGGKNNKAWHTNTPVGQPLRFTSNPLLYLLHIVTPYTPAEKAGFARTKWFLTKAWIYEKLHNWTDAYPWEDDEILTWISIYWFSRAGPAASLRIYYECSQAGALSTKKPTIPVGLSFFPKELEAFSRKWTRAIGTNVVFEAEHDSGGHHAAYEKPDVLVGDLHRMFGKGGPAFGVVPGKTGYA